MPISLVEVGQIIHLTGINGISGESTYMTTSVLNAMWGFPKMMLPNNMGFPNKHDNFGMFWGYPYFWKPTCIRICIYSHGTH